MIDAYECKERAQRASKKKKEHRSIIFYLIVWRIKRAVKKAARRGYIEKQFCYDRLHCFYFLWRIYLRDSARRHKVGKYFEERGFFTVGCGRATLSVDWSNAKNRLERAIEH